MRYVHSWTRTKKQFGARSMMEAAEEARFCARHNDLSGSKHHARLAASIYFQLDPRELSAARALFR